MGESKAPLDVPCPACGAAVGELCLMDGRRVQPHSVREDIALGLPTIYSSEEIAPCYICGNEPTEVNGVGELCLASADPEGDTGYGW